MCGLTDDVLGTIRPCICQARKASRSARIKVEYFSKICRKKLVLIGKYVHTCALLTIYSLSSKLVAAEGSCCGPTLAMRKDMSALPLAKISPRGPKARQVPGKAWTSFNLHIDLRDAVDKRCRLKSDVLTAMCLPLGLAGVETSAVRPLAEPLEAPARRSPDFHHRRRAFRDLPCLDQLP